MFGYAVDMINIMFYIPRVGIGQTAAPLVAAASGPEARNAVRAADTS